MTSFPDQRPVSAVRALLLGLSATAAGGWPGLCLIAAFAAEALVDVGMALAFFVLLKRGAAAAGAAFGGLFVLWVLARLWRYLTAGGLLGAFAARQRGAQGTSFTAAALRFAPRSLIALLGTLLVEAFSSAWKWAALTATGWAYVSSLVQGHGGTRAAFALALCLTVVLALALFGRLWVDAAFAASIVGDAPFSSSLGRAAAAIAARPMTYLGLLLATGVAGGMVEAGIAGSFNLFTAGKLPPSAMLSLGVATRVAGALLTAWPMALAWGGRVGAFAALELAARGELPPPPVKAVQKPIPVAQLLPDPPPAAPANDLA